MTTIRDYIIGVGGGGARAMLPVLYLTAAGIFSRPLRLFQIDPDQANGNGAAARDACSAYGVLQAARCTVNNARAWSDAVQGGGRTAHMPAFTVAVNGGGAGREPFLWHREGRQDIAFADLIGYQQCGHDVRQFVDLFFTAAEREMTIERGYRGRTSVGAVALDMDWERSAGNPEGGLAELIDGLHHDLMAGPVRVFVIGTCFGGSGAAALPLLPAMLRRHLHQRGGTDARRLTFGCAILTPYFSYPADISGAVHSVSPNSRFHRALARAAIAHHAVVPPEYRSVFLVGAPEQQRTAGCFADGGGAQRNSAHYVELVAALAAHAFVAGPVPEQRTVYMATERETETSNQIPGQISWATLPCGAGTEDRANLRSTWISFTVMAYFFARVFHPALADPANSAERLWYAPWFRGRFGRGELSASNAEVTLLKSFCEGYLVWLQQALASMPAGVNKLFDLEQLRRTNPADAGAAPPDIRERASRLGGLAVWTNPENSVASDAFNQFMRRLDQVTAPGPGGNPTGRLIEAFAKAARLFVNDCDAPG